MIWFFFITVLSCGCSDSLVRDLDRIPFLKEDKSFSYSALKKGGMAFGGIVSVFNSLAKSKRLEYDRLVRKAVRSLTEHKIISSSLIEKALGQKNYKKMLTHYKMNDHLSPFWLNKLRQKVKGVRYIIIACIDTNEIEKMTFKLTDIHIEMKKNIRHFFVLYRFYDLKTGIIVAEGWAGGHFETDYKNTATHPKLPITKKRMVMIFESFARRLPRDPRKIRQEKLQKKKNRKNKKQKNVKNNKSNVNQHGTK